MWCRPRSPSPRPTHARRPRVWAGRGGPERGAGASASSRARVAPGEELPGPGREDRQPPGASCQVPATAARRAGLEPRRPCYLELSAGRRLPTDSTPAGHRPPFIAKPARGLPVRSPLRKALRRRASPPSATLAPALMVTRARAPLHSSLSPGPPGQLSTWSVLRASCRRLLACEQGRLPGPALLAQLPEQGPVHGSLRKLAWTAEGRPGPPAGVDLCGGP